MRGQPGRRGLNHVVDRRLTARGELVLRRDGPHFEIISNGVFLMDTRAGQSERLLVRLPLDARTRPARVLLGGLGVGFSLRAALAHSRTLEVTVVEVESAVIDWQRHLAAFSGRAVDDPRVRVVCADLLDWLAADRERFDVICVDIDNGPPWTVTERNAELYTAAGLTRLRDRLAPDGTLAVWSAAEDATFRARLSRLFGTVQRHVVPVDRGEPDVIYLADSHRASRPHG